MKRGSSNLEHIECASSCTSLRMKFEAQHVRLTVPFVEQAQAIIQFGDVKPKTVSGEHFLNPPPSRPAHCRS